MKMQSGLEGAGAAFLLLYSYYLPLLHPKNHALFHHDLPITSLIGGILLDLLVVAILAAGFLAVVQRLPQAVRRIVEALFAGLMLWSAVALANQVFIDMWFPISRWGNLWAQCVLAIPLLMGLLACIFPRAIQFAVRAVRLALSAFAFSSIWIIPHLLYIALASHPAQSATLTAQSTATHSSSPQRIVWILFDELSYDQTFEHPAAGLTLPQFTRLRSQSTSFSNLKPAGYYTDLIIPSLFLGRRIDRFRSSVNGELSYWESSQRRWIFYDPHTTLFGLAQQSGWDTGVDGWYNPYCRVFAPVLNACYWSAGVVLPMEDYGAANDHSAPANAIAAPNQLLAALTNRTRTPEETHLQSYRDIMAHSRALIDDSRLQFIYLHLPVPHPPGIYDRKLHTLRTGGNYLDNLVLADDTLGILLGEINASPSGSQTTVIISSDHSWRTPIYRSRKDWSAEEERASGGGFDDRPVLLIHFPGQTSGSDIAAALPELLEHDIIAGMLTGKISNQTGLAAYLQQHSR